MLKARSATEPRLVKVEMGLGITDLKGIMRRVLRVSGHSMSWVLRLYVRGPMPFPGIFDDVIVYVI